MKPIFPGMDPYLEGPGTWPGFHDAFISYTREALQPILPENYYADIRTREEIGIAGFRGEKVRYPDQDLRPSSGILATVPERLEILEAEPLRVSFLEIRDAARDDRLATLIEIVSRTNKLPGPDRDSFERKQGEVLSSQANWVAIDLLRTGLRILPHPSVEAHCRRKGYDYAIAVSRANRRSPRLDLEIYGFTARSELPVASIPLLEPDPDVPLDLGPVFRRAYESGPYGKIVNYREPPDPPLRPEDAGWARGIIEASLAG